ncbi:MAG: chaperone modulator CbpM [Steroidobacteraceae bacterium]|jgi:chaperone modulatory protein CbpM
MGSDRQGSLSGEIFEECAVLGVDELSRLCAVDRTYIVELVEEGVLSVASFDAALVHGDASQWRFAGSALRRARTALRLQRDLEINLPGVALALELLEELDELRRELEGGRRW